MSFEKYDLTQSGAFALGCNYWASHAGTMMWSDWKPEVVESDFKQLSGEGGMTVLRVFPLWSDFQPLTLMAGCQGNPMEYRMGENPLPDTEAGRAGVSEEMIERFACLADLASENGIDLVVGLMTGWMSGRLFVPQAFASRNALNDPEIIRWELRFVKHFVKRFSKHPAIIAWNLGNECNCLGKASNRDEAWLWASSISNAIKSVDQSRPVISGMYGLQVDQKSTWTIRDQAELTDVLTVHPYPLFTPHCNQDPINEIRNGLHATSSSVLYSSVGGRPCVVEEVGNLGPSFASNEVAAKFARSLMFSAWAHDLRMVKWWCAYDFDNLDFAPYDWHAYECELGLIQSDGVAKPVLKEFKRFSEFLKRAPKLPERRKSAVCALTLGQDNWAVAFSSFILAKQAGFDLEFRASDQTFAESDLYLLPSVQGNQVLSRRKWLELIDRVKKGATLYISGDSNQFVWFKDIVGLEPVVREKRTDNLSFTIPGIDENLEFSCKSEYKTRHNVNGATVLGSESDQNPAFTKFKLGEGNVFFLATSIEQTLSQTPGAFHSENATPWWKIYREILNSTGHQPLLAKNNPFLGITEHREDESTCHCVVINYSSVIIEDELILDPSWKILDTPYGVLDHDDKGHCALALKGNDAVVVTLTKN